MSKPDQQPAPRVILTPASEIQPELARHDWGPWKLRQATRELYLDSDADPARRHYTIPLDTFTGSADLLDLICQVAAKTWADAATVAGLVWALTDILTPQAHICGGGVDRRITPAILGRLVDAYRPE